MNSRNMPPKKLSAVVGTRQSFVILSNSHLNYTFAQKKISVVQPFPLKRVFSTITTNNSQIYLIWVTV